MAPPENHPKMIQQRPQTPDSKGTTNGHKPHENDPILKGLGACTHDHKKKHQILTKNEALKNPILKARGQKTHSKTSPKTHHFGWWVDGWMDGGG